VNIEVVYTWSWMCLVSKREILRFDQGENQMEYTYETGRSATYSWRVGALSNSKNKDTCQKLWLVYISY
jgi:hypothetical protein